MPRPSFKFKLNRTTFNRVEAISNRSGCVFCGYSLDVRHFLENAQLDIRWKLDLVSLQMQLRDHVLQGDALFALQRADLPVAVVERLLHQAVHDQLNVLLSRLTTAGVHIVGVHAIVRHRGALQQVDHLSHVAAAQVDQRLSAVVGHVQLFRLDHVLQSRQNLLLAQRTETKARTSGLQCRYDLGQVVADQTEANVLGVLLHDSSQGILCVTLNKKNETCEKISKVVRGQWGGKKRLAES